MKRAFKALRWAVLLVALLVGVLLAGCGGVVWNAIAANNRLVRGWEDALRQQPLPPKSELLSFDRSEFGLLEGNGNHCDIRVALSVLTWLSPSEVEAYYKTSGVAERVGSAGDGPIFFTVWARGRPWSDGRAVIRVELFGHGGNKGDNGGFDPRCH